MNVIDVYIESLNLIIKIQHSECMVVPRHLKNATGRKRIKLFN